MDKVKAKKEIEKLTKEILAHDERYYNLDRPTIADQEYDLLLKRLMDLEEQFPGLRGPDSPTQRVGAKLEKSLRAIPHKVKMLSLDNTYSFEEMKEWETRVLKGLPGENIEYVAELKIDGVSASLIYQDGIFTMGATRGDGFIGEDITNNLKTIRSVPLVLKKIKGHDFPKLLEVRGEVYMERKDFELLNKAKQEKGEVLFANPRNAASGSVKLLDSRMTVSRKLNCFIHSFGILSGGKPCESHWEFLSQAQTYGFPVNTHRRLCKSLKDVISFCQEYQDKRDTIPYEIDGVVVKVNSFRQRSQLGETLKSPRWAMAYKFPAQQATTIVKEIVVQVGRTGVLTPVAELEPVECAGVVISRSTLHNFDEIKRLGVKKGDRVLIERAGDVIPKITQVVESSVDRVEHPFKIPTHCPVCGGKVAKSKEEDVAYRCINPSCPRQMEKGLIHFASRGAMDIEGLGESAVRQLLEKKFVKDLADIYFLKKNQLLELELFKDKKADNLLAAIEQSKARPLSRFLFALGIWNIGEKAAYTLAQRFGYIDNLMTASSEQLNAIHEIGDVMAESVKNFFGQKSTRKLIKRFKSAGLRLTEPRGRAVNTKLSGKKFVLTGELDGLTRQEASARIKRMGAAVVESVSRKTDFVVVGANPGSKYQKAVDLGVKILNQSEFEEMMNE